MLLAVFVVLIGCSEIAIPQNNSIDTPTDVSETTTENTAPMTTDLLPETIGTESVQTEAPETDNIETMPNATSEKTALPSMTSSTLSFSSIREMKYILENDLLSEQDKASATYNHKYDEVLECDTNRLYELKNLPEGVSNDFVEWAGFNRYSIGYLSATSARFSMDTYGDNEALCDFMEQKLKYCGSVEKLSQNKFLSNIRESEQETPYGVQKIFTFNTSSVENLVDTHLDYVHPNNGYTYHLYETYTLNSDFGYAILFAFHEEFPFVSYFFDEQPSLDFLLSLEAGLVTAE